MEAIIIWLGVSLATETLDDQYLAAKNWYIKEGVTAKVKQFFIDEYNKEQVKPPAKPYLWYMRKNIKE